MEIPYTGKIARRQKKIRNRVYANVPRRELSHSVTAKELLMAYKDEDDLRLMKDDMRGI